MSADGRPDVSQLIDDVRAPCVTAVSRPFCVVREAQDHGAKLLCRSLLSHPYDKKRKQAQEQTAYIPIGEPVILC